MSVLNRNAFAVVAAPVSVITPIVIDDQLVEIHVPEAMFDKVCLFAPMALRAAVDVRAKEPYPVQKMPDYYEGR